MGLVINTKEYEYKTKMQSEITWGETFKMSVKAPLIADRIFKTFSDANKYIHDNRNSAIRGLILTVIDENDNKGLYFVDGIKRPSGYIDDFNNVYDGNEYELVLVKVYIETDTGIQSDWNETNTATATYIKNKPNITDNQKKISFVGRVDFIDGKPKITRTLIESKDGIIKLEKGNINYALFGTIPPNVHIEWIEYVPNENDNVPNSFSSFEEALIYFSDKDKSIYPEYIRCGQNGVYKYYFLTFEKINFSVNVDNETIIKDEKNTDTGIITCLRVNVPSLKIGNYNDLEDDTFIKRIKFIKNHKYRFLYIEVNAEDFIGIKFKQVEEIPQEINIESPRFIEVDNKNYLKTDFIIDDVILNNGDLIQESDINECIFMLYGIIYKGFIKDNTVYFYQKTVSDGDNLLKILETFEKMIYNADYGTYLY